MKNLFFYIQVLVGLFIAYKQTTAATIGRYSLLCIQNLLKMYILAFLGSETSSILSFHVWTVDFKYMERKKLMYYQPLLIEFRKRKKMWYNDVWQELRRTLLVMKNVTNSCQKHSCIKLSFIGFAYIQRCFMNKLLRDTCCSIEVVSCEGMNSVCQMRISFIWSRFFSLWPNNLASVISSSDLEHESPLRFCWIKKKDGSQVTIAANSADGRFWLKNYGAFQIGLVGF